MEQIILYIIWILVFLIQVWLCTLNKNIHFKLIPLYLLVLGIAYCICLYVGVFGIDGPGVIFGKQFMAVVLGLLFVITLGIDLVAWIIFGIFKYLKKNGIIK